MVLNRQVHLKYRLNLEDTNHAVNVYAGPSNVYTLQRVINILLSRCAIQSDGETAVQAETSMMYKDLGTVKFCAEHGADNTPYFWLVMVL